MCDIWHKSHWHCWSSAQKENMLSGGCDLMVKGWNVVMQIELAEIITQIVNYPRYYISYYHHIIQPYPTWSTYSIDIIHHYPTCCLQDYPKQRIDQNASFAQAKILWTTIRYIKFASNQGQPKSPLKPIALVWRFDVCMTGSDNHLALPGWWFV